MPGADDIENKIIDSIESNTGDDLSGGGNNDAGGGGDGGQPNSSAEPTTSAEPRQQNDAPQQRNGQDRSQQNQQRGQQRGKKEEKVEGKDGHLRDGKGNLIDQQGNVIAAHGKERRLFAQNERLKTTLNSQTNEIRELKQRLEQNDVMRGMPQQYGLSSNDMNDMFSIAGAMKQDPVRGARLALEYALAQGADLTSIIQAENLQNISFAAQKRMLDDHYRRTNGPIEEQRRQQQHAEQVRNNVTRFTNTHSEYAEHFDDVGAMIPEEIKRAANEGRQIDEYTAAEMSLQRLVNYAMQNGLDPRRNIGEQIEEIKMGRGSPQQDPRQQRSPQPRRAAPMPNGGRGAMATPSRSGSLPANATTDTIVRDAMRASGYYKDR